MSPIIIVDDQIQDELTATNALAWIEEALRRRACGQLQSPPRIRAELAGGHMAFTVGSSGEDWYGYRAYDTLNTPDGEQVVVAHDGKTGKVIGVAIGNELGIRRTGALGGVAAKHLTGGTVRNVGVIGTGQQAWAQLWALNGFATPSRIRVYSRTRSARETFAARVDEELRLNAEPVPDARTAVAGADLVILATNSSVPTLDTAWLNNDVTVITLGPKQVGRAEFSADLVTAADFVVTDSPAQLASYDPPALVADLAQEMNDLADLVSGTIVAPTSGRRVYCSVGLAGTEVHLLGHLAAAATEGGTLKTSREESLGDKPRLHDIE